MTTAKLSEQAIMQLSARVAALEVQRDALLAACEAALAVLPGLEVRSWPPGHDLKREAITQLQAAISRARGAQ